MQVAIAALGLGIQIEETDHLFLVNGDVAVPNLGAFAWGNASDITQIQQLYASHTLGLIGSSMYFGNGQENDYLGAVQDEGNQTARTIFQDPDGWTYRFVDSSPDGKISFATQRTISSKFGCRTLEVEYGEDGSSLDTVKVNGFSDDFLGDTIYIGDSIEGASTYVVSTRPTGVFDV